MAFLNAQKDNFHHIHSFKLNSSLCFQIYGDRILRNSYALNEWLLKIHCTERFYFVIPEIDVLKDKSGVEEKLINVAKELAKHHEG